MSVLRTRNSAAQHALNVLATAQPVRTMFAQGMRGTIALGAQTPVGQAPRLIAARNVVAPGAWIAGIVVSSLLALWLTGQAWLAEVVGIAGMVLAARHSVKMLAAARNTLEQAQRDRAAMEQALRESQKMEALGRLTVGVAHDFNNHLTVISSNVEMLARRLDVSQQHLLRHTDAAIQGVQRAAALTGRLLSFPRQPSSEPEAVDVDRILSSLSDLLRRTLGDRVELEVLSPETPWLIWADVNRMENALLSLTVNARDQVRDGATLTIAVSNLHLDEALQAACATLVPGDYVQIAITDSIAPVEFHGWGEDSTSLDLSMARAFVREAGGCLLRQDPSTDALALKLVLPRYAPSGRADTVSRQDAGGRSTVLVVEDDAAVRLACVEALRDLDYKVLEAPDAMEAFRLIADHGGIDLLLTDLGLPGGVSGRALADAARNVDPALRVLFTTGYEHFDLTGRPGTALLRKPFNPAQLASMVRDVLTVQSPEGQPQCYRPATLDPRECTVKTPV